MGIEFGIGFLADRYIIAGETESYGGSGIDVGLIKTDANGSVDEDGLATIFYARFYLDPSNRQFHCNNSTPL
jgi:hypothetical protein